MNVPPPEAVLASPSRTPVPSSQIWSPLSASAIAYGGDPATSSSRASATCHEYAAFDVAELAGRDGPDAPLGVGCSIVGLTASGSVLAEATCASRGTRTG